jgi:high-affinity Fe2+/Pb2+ permease
MNDWSHWIRQSHRWLSIAFTLAVIANFVALARDQRAVWIGVMALIPLFLLLASGLYLFVLPHARKWRSGPRGAAASQPSEREAT